MASNSGRIPTTKEERTQFRKFKQVFNGRKDEKENRVNTKSRNDSRNTMKKKLST